MSSTLIGLVAFFALLAVTQAMPSRDLQISPINEDLQSSCIKIPVSETTPGGPDGPKDIPVGHIDVCPIDEKCKSVKLSLAPVFAKSFGNASIITICKHETFGELHECCCMLLLSCVTLKILLQIIVSSQMFAVNLVQIQLLLMHITIAVKYSLVCQSISRSSLSLLYVWIF